MNNHTVRNNVFYTDEKGAVFSISQDRWLDSITIGNNLIYNYNSTNTMIKPDTSVLNFTAFQADRAAWTGNAWGDPVFTATNRDWYMQPWKYDLTTSSNSPAKGLGVTTGMPALDIKGVTRVGYDAGAYEIGSSVTTGFTIGIGSQTFTIGVGSQTFTVTP